MNSQPPRDAPAPPPSEEARKSVWFLIGTDLLMVGLIFFSPGCKSQRKIDYQTADVSNSQQIGLALFEFENDYGTYPNSTTAAEIAAKTHTAIPLGTTTSNDFFRQLIAGDYTRSEKMFYAKIDGIHKPDDVIDGTEALKKGECAFTYLTGAKSGDNPLRPVVVAPMIPGTDRFDPNPFDGKAIILRLDGSPTRVPIDKDGHAIIAGRNGMALFDPKNPIWDGHAPVIAWPDL